jgi:hypothetical protein
MSPPAVSIAVGTVIALVVLVYVLLPVLGVTPPAARTRGGNSGRGDRVPADAGTTAVDTLREIEFDRETGKLSDADYHALKKTYTERALSELRAADTGASPSLGPPNAPPNAPPNGPPNAPVTESVAASATPSPGAAAPVCPACGPRVESDALYCSTCARYLPGSCVACGATVAEAGARYCGSCGQRLDTAARSQRPEARTADSAALER